MHTVKRLAVFALGMVIVAVTGRAVMANSSSGQAVATTVRQQSARVLAYNVATPHDAAIPSQALRLRIIANSDSTADQNTKRAVRDAVVVQVAKLVSGAQTEAQAQQIVTTALPQLRATAARVAAQRGYTYAVTAAVGEQPFPTKLYGNQVYPAGNYRALVITLGQGAGQNWWCVLFPPLCFIDIASGDAVPNTAGFPDLPPLEILNIPGPTGRAEPVQVRLATLDYGEEVWKAVRRWLP